MKWRYCLRVASLLVSTSICLIREDPTGFSTKLAARLRTSENELISRLPTSPLKLVSAPASRAKTLVELGYLSKGAALVAHEGSSASSSDRHLASRTREYLEQLTQTPPLPARKRKKSAKHRVLHYLTNSVPYTRSGYTLRSHKVLKAQKTAGLEVQGVTRLAYPVLVGKIPLSQSQVVDAIEYHRLLPRTYPVSLLERDQKEVEMLVEKAKQFEATVLHTTTDFRNAAVVSKAASRLGIPWVYEVRGELESTWLSKQPASRQNQAESSEFYQLARNQETAFAKSAHAVVTLSQIVKNQLVGRGVDSEKIYVIPNAVDTQDLERDFDRSEIRVKLNLPSNILIGTVTSIVGYEGIDTLLRALKYLPDSVEVLIVGDGDARPKLEELSRELGLRTRVHFVGRKPQDEIWQWYAALDVFVVPRKDLRVCRVVTPIKVLAAQALGIPVVASDLPALREVTGNRAEYVVPDDPHALASGIRNQLQGKPHRENDIDWLTSRTWAANADRYFRLYNCL